LAQKLEVKIPYGAPKHRWDDNNKNGSWSNKMDECGLHLSGSQLGQVAGSWEHSNEPWSSNMQEIFWLSRELLASQKGLCSMEFISYVLNQITVQNLRMFPWIFCTLGIYRSKKYSLTEFYYNN
jgi:hypothetical protein